MKEINFDFSVSNDGDIDSVDCLEEEYQEVSNDLMKKLLEKKKIVLGEKSEGNVCVEDDIVKLSYKVCTELGEDWDSDVWEDVESSIPLSHL